MYSRPKFFILSSALFAAAAQPGQAAEFALTTVASSKAQLTGVAVAKDARIFVNYPRWSDSVTKSVAVLDKDGAATAYPDAEWNEWKGDKPQEHFVCVQAVFADRAGNLWMVDSGNPKFEGVIANAPKLIKVDLKTNKIARVYKIDDSAAPKNSYLNDVRIDARRNRAYLTDSGLGAIVIVDLASGKAMRRLVDHPSTKAEDIKLVINGKEFGKLPDGSYRKVHSDGIALAPDAAYLYYQALTGKNLYRVPVKDLVDGKVSDADLGKKVEHVAVTCPADGIEFGTDGKLYISSLEDNSVKKLDTTKKGASLETVVKDEALVWPDSFANGPNGTMYVTSSQINLGPDPATPYRVFKFKLGAK